jgi:predicted O-methyltransferase YrrM
VLGEQHRRIGDLVADIPGLLRPEDELKLYELAQQTAGPIFEIGTYRGRSATIMALGAKAGQGALLISVDVDPKAQRAAAAALAAAGVADNVLLVRGSAAAALRVLPGLAPRLTFVDGDHSADGVRSDVAALERAIPNGGLLLFHDFVDPRNDNPDIEDIGVKAGIADSWVARECDLIGEYGVCGLFRRREGGEVGAGPPVIDARWRDSLRMQYLQRLRWPAARAARGFLRRFGQSDS